MPEPEIVEGAVFTIAYPFVRDWATIDFDDAGPVNGATWKPGTRAEPFGPYGEESETVADARGACEFRVVSVHKPGKRYAARVFFTRRFQTPDGKWFGKANLRVTDVSAFRRRIRGYMHPFRVEGEEPAEVNDVSF